MSPFDKTGGGLRGEATRLAFARDHRDEALGLPGFAQRSAAGSRTCAAQELRRRRRFFPYAAKRLRREADKLRGRTYCDGAYIRVRKGATHAQK